MWIWIKENTGILTLILVTINVFVGITKFWLLRWQGYERGQDLRDLLFGKKLKEEVMVLLSKKRLGKEANTSGLKEFLKEPLTSIVCYPLPVFIDNAERRCRI